MNAETWLLENFPDMLKHIYRYMIRNDGYTFVEAFESVDSVIYGLWRDS